MKKGILFGGAALLGAGYLLTRPRSAGVAGTGTVPLKSSLSSDYILSAAQRVVQRHGNEMLDSLAANGGTVSFNELLTVVLKENNRADETLVNRSVGRYSVDWPVGLGQIKPFVVVDYFLTAQKKGFITPAVEEITVRQLGSARWRKILAATSPEGSGYKIVNGKRQYVGGEYVAVRDLQNPAFNLLLVGLILRVLKSEHTQGQRTDMAKVLLRYNQGYFFERSRLLNPNFAASPEKLATIAPPEGKKYLADTLGRGGILPTINLKPVRVNS